VGDEFEHVASYLAIQKIRYRDILDYQIDVDDAILSATILKLTCNRWSKMRSITASRTSAAAA
jgi:LytS/YehU family sensor histidine kinase